jgi:hypothetical protein
MFIFQTAESAKAAVVALRARATLINPPIETGKTIILLRIDSSCPSLGRHRSL